MTQDETCGFFSEAQTEKITTLSRPTRYRMQAKGEFPSRYRISEGRIGYKKSEVIEWLETRPLDLPKFNESR